MERVSGVADDPKPRRQMELAARRASGQQLEGRGQMVVGNPSQTAGHRFDAPTDQPPLGGGVEQRQPIGPKMQGLLVAAGGATFQQRFDQAPDPLLLIPQQCRRSVEGFGYGPGCSPVEAGAAGRAGSGFSENPDSGSIRR